MLQSEFNNLKAGDRLVVHGEKPGGTQCGNHYGDHNAIVVDKGRNQVYFKFEADSETCIHDFEEKRADGIPILTLIKTNQMFMSNLTEKFTLALTPEPFKSFRKAGITNGDNILTDEGQKVFMSWLLSQNQDAFKKEVVDGILKDIKEEKEK